MARKPAAVPLDLVPPIPNRLVGEACMGGDVVFNDGQHRWRQDRDGVLVYYIRYSEGRDRQEAVYARPRR